MKKLFALFVMMSFFTIGLSFQSFAQDEDTTKTEEQTDTTKKEEVQEETKEETPAAEETKEAKEEATAAAGEEKTFHQTVKGYFIDGGWVFMSLPLICLVLGLAVALERIISLTLATTNTDKIIKIVENKLQNGGVDSAIEATQKTRGPIASIFTQGLMRYNEGLDMVEKSVVAYGSVEMSKLEKGLSWISLFIAIAPMLGFMGTVIGMVQAFDAIVASKSMEVTVLAGNIKVALLTTLAGLIVAITLQVFYNYITSRIESMVIQMEDASIALIDKLVDYKAGYNN